MTTEQFIKKNDCSSQLYLIYGSSAFLAQQARDALVNALNCDMMNLDTLDDASADDVIARAEQMPCFAEYRLIIIREFALFGAKSQDEEEEGSKEKSKPKGKGKGKDSDALKKEAERFTEYLKTLPETTKLLFLCSGQPDKRRVLFKYLQQHAEVICADTYAANELINWAVGYARQRGLDIKPQTVRLLADMSGTEMQTLASEIDKLAMLGRSAIRDADIKKYASANLDYLVFDLHTYMLKNECENAFTLAKKIFSAERTFIPVAAFLQKRFDLMNMAKSCLLRGMSDDKTQNLILSAVKEKPGYVWYCIQDCKSFSPGQLRAAIKLLAEYEYALKSGGADPGIESVLLRIYDREDM